MFENTANQPSINSPPLIQPANQIPIYQADTMPNFLGNMTYQLVYPELFYRLQPFILIGCDQMDNGPMIPTQEMIEHMSDSIYEDVHRMYPDMAEYASSYDRRAKDDPPRIEVRDLGMRDLGMRDRGLGMFDHRFRRRGMLHDLIDILLISELFRRRRRMY
jgi:hypothetical protein